MKLKYFDDLSDDIVCLIRVDDLDKYHERFFVLNKEYFYTLKKSDDTFETFADTNCWPSMHIQVMTKQDGRAYVYDDDSSTFKPIASWTYNLLGNGIKQVIIGPKRVGIILPNDPNKMYFPRHYEGIVLSALHDANDTYDTYDNEEEGPNDDVTLSDDLCLISTSDKTRFLKELSSRQKSGYELCNMTTSCIQVNGRLEVVFSSLLKAKEDTKDE